MEEGPNTQGSSSYYLETIPITHLTSPIPVSVQLPTPQSIYLLSQQIHMDPNITIPIYIVLTGPPTTSANLFQISIDYGIN